MKPWAKWLIKHKLGYTLFVILIVAIPFVGIYVIALAVPKFCRDLYSWLTDDWLTLWREIKRLSEKE